MSKPKVSLVIPFIDTWEVTKRCLEKVRENTSPDTEIILIDNGSQGDYEDFILQIFYETHPNVLVVKNSINIGVLQTFSQGLALARGEIICFIHNDVLLQEEGWDIKVVEVFDQCPRLGLAGLFGAVGVGENGGRIRSMSKMLGVEWGKCDCHELAWEHHSEYLDGVHPATILDGVGMFFRREALHDLVNSDMFAEWRAPHHFYDRIMPLKLIDKNWKIATIGIGFDHWSGATANSSEIYNDTALKWAEKHNAVADGLNPDQMLYNKAEQQFFDEFGKRLPCNVNSNWEYEYRGLL